MILQISNKDDFNSEIKNGIVVVKFIASLASQETNNHFEELSNKFNDLKFIQIDVSRLAELASEKNVSKQLPSLHIYKDGEKINELTSTAAGDDLLIERLVKQYSTRSSDELLKTGHSTSQSFSSTDSRSSYKSSNLVTLLNSIEEMNSVKQDGAVIIYFSAKWCGACVTADRIYNNCSAKYPDIKFYKIDHEKYEKHVKDLGLKCAPTFRLFKNGNKVDEYTGICEGDNDPFLEKKIINLSSGKSSSSSSSGNHKQRSSASSYRQTSSSKSPSHRQSNSKHHSQSKTHHSTSHSYSTGQSNSSGNHKSHSSASSSNKYAQHNSITYIKSENEFSSLIRSGTVIVDFFAEWCGPCKNIAPVFENLANTYKTLKFAKVDTEKSGNVAVDAGIRTLPTFHAYKDGTKVAEFSGADEGQLKALVEKWA